MSTRGILEVQEQEDSALQDGEYMKGPQKVHKNAPYGKMVRGFHNFWHQNKLTFSLHFSVSFLKCCPYDP